MVRNKEQVEEHPLNIGAKIRRIKGKHYLFIGAGMKSSFWHVRNKERAEEQPPDFGTRNKTHRRETRPWLVQELNPLSDGQK